MTHFNDDVKKLIDTITNTDYTCPIAVARVHSRSDRAMVNYFQNINTDNDIVYFADQDNRVLMYVTPSAQIYLASDEKCCFIGTIVMGPSTLLFKSHHPQLESLDTMVSNKVVECYLSAERYLFVKYFEKFQDIITGEIK